MSGNENFEQLVDLGFRGQQFHAGLFIQFDIFRGEPAQPGSNAGDTLQQPNPSSRFVVLLIGFFSSGWFGKNSTSDVCLAQRRIRCDQILQTGVPLSEFHIALGGAQVQMRRADRVTKPFLEVPVFGSLLGNVEQATAVPGVDNRQTGASERLHRLVIRIFSVDDDGSGQFIQLRFLHFYQVLVAIADYLLIQELG